jgi:Flp pilus assembly protein TadG
LHPPALDTSARLASHRHATTPARKSHQFRAARFVQECY